MSARRRCWIRDDAKGASDDDFGHGYGGLIAVARQYELGRIRRAVNTMIAAMARRGIGSKSTYLLTTTGCRSGLDRTTPVIPVEIGGHHYVVSPYGEVGWVHNVRASGRLILTRGDHNESLLAEEVGADEAGPVLRHYLNQARVTAPFFDAKRDDPAQAFAAEADRHPVFRVKPTGPPDP